jgi:lipoyl(octanoyl) transferase
VPEFIDLAFAPNYISYDDAYQKQLEIHAQVVAGTIPNTVLLLEHSSVYTAGKRTEAEELPLNGSDFVETNRGGKITWHGPGQLVGYAIMRLPQPIDVVNFVRWMEQCANSALHHYTAIVKLFRCYGRLEQHGENDEEQTLILNQNDIFSQIDLANFD